MGTAVSVIGLGNWGTALANHLALKGHNVLGWSIESDVVQGINASGRNIRFLSSVQLAPALKATTDLGAALQREVIVVAIPSSVLTELTPKITAAPRTLVVSAVKGVEEVTLATPLNHIAACHPERYRLAVLSGPSFARDVVVQRPCGVVAASKEEVVAREVADLFSSE
ncbi:MAG: glycerol-3-phosphate dehydrogenase, NAD(P)-dependent, partial [Pseudomonadota bacterium]